MIFILIILFILVILNNKKEGFEINSIYKKNFFNLIDNLNSDGVTQINYDLSIISSINKQYFSLNNDNTGFNKIVIDNFTVLKIKKLREKNKINLLSKNNLYLNYEKSNNLLNTTINNLNDSNIFSIEDIYSTYNELDYNKFRFIGKLKHQDLYLGINGFSNQPEDLLFDFTIDI